MATTQRNDSDKSDGRRAFIVHASRFGVLVNWREVRAAELEGRSITARPHYFKRGDRIALDEEYIEQRNIAKMFRDEALDHDGLPAIEPIELYEKRIAAEAKMEEASRQAGADQAKLAEERRQVQRELQEEFEKNAAATVLEQFSP